MTSKNSQLKSRKAFSHTPAKKEEVGEFANGYFVMPEQQPSLASLPDSTKTRTRRNKDAEFTTPTKTPNKAKSFSPETSPVKTPQRGTSPQKSEKSTSPSSTKRWAGSAFGNAPPPSSLPLPDFSSVVPASQQPPVAPIYAQTPPPMSLAAPQYYSPAPYALHHSVAPQVSPAHYHYPTPSHVMPIVHSTQPSLGELSNDLRRLLNIGDSSILVQAS